MADRALARETFFSLRETIARMEGKPAHRLEAQAAAGVEGSSPALCRKGGEAFLATGIEALDQVLDGGLPRAGLAEIRAAALRNAGAATGLALSVCAFLQRHDGAAVSDRAILWVGERGTAREAGEPFAEGLRDHGLSLDHLLYAAPRRLEEALWLAEAAVTSRAFRAVILEIAGNPQRFGLSESRRLSLRARHAGCLLLLLRQGGEEEAGSTLFRMRADPAPSGAYRLADGTVLKGTIGAPGFSLTVEKSMRPASSLVSPTIPLEWNAHERLLARPAPALPLHEQPGRFQPPAHPVAGLPDAADRPDRPAAMGAVLAFSRAS